MAMSGITLRGAGRFGYQTQQYTSEKVSGMSLRDRYYFGSVGDWSSGKTIHVYKDALYSTGGGNGQELHLDYDKSSTEDNPVIRAWGVDSNGKEYEELIYVNQVNPRYATTAEMQALEVHLKKQGDSVLTAQMPRKFNLIGRALSGFDVHEKIDFIQLFHELADKTMEPGIDVSTRLDADRFLYLWLSKEKELMEELS